MNALVWVLIAAAIVVLVALALVVARRRRTAGLRQHFGPEYDRTVQTSDDRRAAESDLRGREKQRGQFETRPLPESMQVRFAEEWRTVQERFVDQPSNAVVEADGLMYRVMEARGYPMQDFEEQANLVSVDHPHVVENYRSAHAVYDQAQTQRADTEDLRRALVSYRALFDELLESDDRATDVADDRSDRSTQ